MSQPSLETRKRWWLLCYAVTSMEKAAQCCELLVGNCPTNDHPFFGPLAVAVHAYYARPFKNSRGVGRLPEDLVPEDHGGIHRWLMHFRDTALAHTDAEHAEVAGRPMNDLVYSVSGEEQQFSTQEPRVQPENYRHVVAHCRALRKVFLAKVLDLHEQYRGCMPARDGDFMLSLDEETDLFEPYDLPDQETLTYE